MLPNIFKDNKVSISERVTFLLRVSFAAFLCCLWDQRSAFNFRFSTKIWGLILVYTVSDKFALTGKLVMRTYCPYIQI